LVAVAMPSIRVAGQRARIENVMACFLHWGGLTTRFRRCYDPRGSDRKAAPR
jgi:hypothetical protein